MPEFVELNDLLVAKENRQATQKLLLKTFQCTLVCFTVNYVGNVKKDSTTQFIFEQGIQAIKNAFFGKVKFFLGKHLFTGFEGYFAVELQAKEAKNISCNIEDFTDMGRLFDIDVFDQQGQQISRQQLGQPARKCLVCDCPAAECYVLRRHTAQSLMQKINDIVGAYQIKG